MTAEERLALLEDLQAREPAAAHRARLWAWLSVVLAATISGALLFAAYRQLSQVESQVSAKREELNQLTKELEQTNTKLQASQRTTGALQIVVSELPKNQVDAGFAAAIQKDPSIEKVLARVYIQSTPADKERATVVQNSLRKAGFVVPGIDTRPDPVRRTQVRFFRPDEIPQANKIADVLKGLGEQVMKPQPVAGAERVRPNTFEVWLSPAAVPQ